MGTKAQETKPVVSAQFARDLDTYVKSNFDLSSGGEGVTNELWSSETKAFMDAATLKSLFFTEDWVFIVVDLIANKISSHALRVYQKIVQGESASIEPVPDHPMNAMLEQPNTWQDYAQWMYNTVTELFLMGNSVIWNAPRTGQLITLPSETISIDFEYGGKIRGYGVYDISELQASRELKLQQTLDPKQVIHVRRPNPSSLLWGLSPFIPGKRTILFNRYSTDYLNAFYQKQATPGLALSLDRQVNEDVALRQLRSFEVAYQGRKNQRRTLILPKGVTATTLTHSLADQKLIDHINQNRETTLALLKVPKHEVGLAQQGSLGSEEYKIALRNFWSACLIPGMKLIEGMLTRHFQKELGEGHFLAFDISDVDALKDDLAKKAELAKAMLAGGLSVNEVRQEVWKQEPSDEPGADSPFVLKPSSPFGGGAPAALPPADPQPTPEPAPTPETEADKAITPRVKLTFTPELENFRAHVVKQLMDEEARTLDILSTAAIKLLTGMTGEALDVYANLVKSWGPVVTKAKDSVGKRALQRAIQRRLNEEFEEQWQNEIAKTLSKSVDLGYDQQLQVIFNEKARREVEVLRARDEEKRRLTLAARGLDSFENISKTHTERIMSEITAGQERGESVTSIMRAVAGLLGTPGQLAGKAETIARTETLTAVSIGQAAAVRNAKEVMPKLKKAWLTAGDDRVRDSHAEINGDIIDVDEKFSNGLDHPRDVESGDPAEVINCRCTLLLIPPGENLEIP